MESTVWAMRCHPERTWRGVNPPPNFQRSEGCLPVYFTEKDHEVASSLVLLSNGPTVTATAMDTPCSVLGKGYRGVDVDGASRWRKRCLVGEDLEMEMKFSCRVLRGLLEKKSKLRNKPEPQPWSLVDGVDDPIPLLVHPT
ncbi:hypothetical protein NE237_002245 [Protea cynaroides]|uniref:Uncharacterized protein n=1 Tax=Protea cynaroides TaxID=273540 RepID=A0A9Q0KVR9_9MAGN|nr:hypothetical protein NE237_002245 [Protea cynaroides]